MMALRLLTMALIQAPKPCEFLLRASQVPNGARKRKGRPEAAIRISLGKREKIGAGKGIRTLDPNLGKVVLYP